MAEEQKKQITDSGLTVSSPNINFSQEISAVPTSESSLGVGPKKVDALKKSLHSLGISDPTEGQVSGKTLYCLVWQTRPSHDLTDTIKE